MWKYVLSLFSQSLIPVCALELSECLCWWFPECPLLVVSRVCLLVVPRVSPVGGFPSVLANAFPSVPCERECPEIVINVCAEWGPFRGHFRPLDGNFLVLGGSWGPFGAKKGSREGLGGLVGGPERAPRQKKSSLGGPSGRQKVVQEGS